MVEISEPDYLQGTAEGDCLEPIIRDGQLQVADRGATAVPGDVVLIKWKLGRGTPLGRPDDKSWAKLMLPPDPNCPDHLLVATLKPPQLILIPWAEIDAIWPIAWAVWTGRNWKFDRRTLGRSVLRELKKAERRLGGILPVGLFDSTRPAA